MMPPTLPSSVSAVVSERRREIGVRLALGARPGRILAAIVQRGVGVTAVGVAVGLAAALVFSRFLETVLYGVQPLDPVTFAGTAIVLLVSAAAASWLPGRKAARLNPIDILRE
jgi:ABC-type antimicrobial peptide transport system permease subunit